jgi:hypothetical protein
MTTSVLVKYYRAVHSANVACTQQWSQAIWHTRSTIMLRVTLPSALRHVTLCVLHPSDAISRSCGVKLSFLMLKSAYLSVHCKKTFFFINKDLSNKRVFSTL